MRIVYKSKNFAQYISITTARCQLPLFGRWCDLAVTAYNILDNPFNASVTAVTFGVRPLSDRDLHKSCSRFEATVDGILRLSRGTGGHRQYFEQDLTFPAIFGEFFDNLNLRDGGLLAAHLVAGNIRRGIESMAETVRQCLPFQFPESTRDLALAEIDRRYGSITRRTLQTFLKAVHWRLMFNESGCTEEQLVHIEAGLEAPIRLHRAGYRGHSDIPVVGAFADVIVGMREVIYTAQAAQYERQRREAQEKRDRQWAEANRRATALLRSVCGNSLATEFEVLGQITVKERDYTFVIRPGLNVHCIDPQGKQGTLCIHTLFFQCNPIDELIIAYLHIKHNFEEYMRTAILHEHEAGFCKIPSKEK